MIEEGLEDAGFTQPVKPFPHAVPFPEAVRQRPPGNIVNREIVQSIQE
jgi:hypothetical protein